MSNHLSASPITTPRTSPRNRTSGTKPGTRVNLTIPQTDPVSPGTQVASSRDGESTSDSSPRMPRDDSTLPDDISKLKEEIKKLDTKENVSRKLRESYKLQNSTLRNDIEVKEKEILELKKTDSRKSKGPRILSQPSRNKFRKKKK